LEDSQSPFAFISEPSEPSLPSPSPPIETVTPASSSDPQPPQAERNANCGSDQPVQKKARVDPEDDKRPQFKCHICTPTSKKTFLGHGLRGHL
jgi:hypothetical protein